MTDSLIRFRRSSRALSRVVGDEVLIAVPGNGELVALSSTGMTIWELLESPANLHELARSLGELYGCGPESIVSEVDTFLHELIEKRVLERDA